MNVSLHGTWQLGPKNEQESALHTTYFAGGKTLDVTLPGDMHSALLENGIISDPYYAKNELSVQWIGKIDWVLKRTFTVSKELLSGSQFLLLDFADTFVTATINGTALPQCNNYFRFWRFDVSSLLHEGENTIQLLFESAERHAIEYAKTFSYPIPYSIYPVYSPNRNLVRKTQCNAGWDWGPCLMVFGVYGICEIEQSDVAYVNYVTTRVLKDNTDSTRWNVTVSADITALKDSETEMTITLAGHTICTKAALHKGAQKLEAQISVENPRLWNPTGYGEPHLYDMHIIFNNIEKSTHKRIGFRTMEIEAIEDSYGKSLTFKVNGRPVFVKGSNWIPCDALPSRHTYEKYDYLLNTLIESGQNTVRIWGGGQYEKDCFYDLCDEKGILIWHDCMFACSLYPSTQDFLENVRMEIRHQVLRLKDHPSIALWCGNNEDLGALTWYEESRKNRDRYLIDYDRLNEGVLAKEIAALDPDRTWWPSSPSAGANDFADCWHTDGRGDMHYWSVWHEKKSFEAYYDITPRFVSEFGYQSFPSLSGVKEYTPDTQLNLTSPIMEFHQRCPGGNSIILENFSRYFRFPEGLENMLYLSQVQQALAIKTAIEYWRSLRPICMGSIIWQLNDVWPVASWSSLEYSGKWKLLHYAAKQFYAPLTLVLYKKDSVIKAYCLNDTNETVEAHIRLDVLAFDGKSADTIVIDKNIAADSAVCVYEQPLSSFAFDPQKYVLHGSLSVGTIAQDSQALQGHTIAENTLFLTFPKECELLQSEIEYTVKEVRPQLFDIVLKAKNPAFYVALDAQDIEGTFDKNLFTLLAGKEAHITFTAKPYFIKTENGTQKNVTLEQFQKALTITTLRDIYQ